METRYLSLDIFDSLSYYQNLETYYTNMLTTMLAHFFSWHLKIRLEGKAPSITVSQLRTLIQHILPMRNFTLQTTPS